MRVIHRSDSKIAPGYSTTTVLAIVHKGHQHRCEVINRQPLIAILSGIVDTLDKHIGCDIGIATESI